MSDEERLQALVAGARILESYLNEVNSRESFAARAILESRAALEALKTLPQDRHSEILVPIGGGLFIQAQASPPDRLVVSVGAGVVIEKTREGAVAFLEERLNEFEEIVRKLEAQRADLTAKLNAARVEAGNLVEKLKTG